ncbi:MAG: hypothetical protein K8T25_24645, partial [Planctomycetia bacterium]|nr:hypothetical protein [Planctomycetia bacterium]
MAITQVPTVITKASDRPKRPPQFRLRTLFWAVTFCSIACAVFVAVGPIWGSMLVLFLALALAHVAGNAIGTRMRDEASRANQRSPALPDHTRGAVPAAESPAPLSQRRPLGVTRIIFTLGGAIGGAMLGRLALVSGQWIPLRAGDWAVGIASCAVLGALAGFLASSFVQVAIWPAVKFFFRRRT